MTARVEVGGKLSDRKGVSLPETTCHSPRLADKDRSDLDAALNTGIDWLALSFVQRPEDIAEAKKITRGRAAVMAKIEKPQAVTRLDEIMELADALMVARGDLGVEMPLEKVPGVQKQITRAARALRQAGGGRDPNAGIDDRNRRCRRAPKSPTSRPPCSKAPTRSCCRRNRQPANIRWKRSPPWTASPRRWNAIRPIAP